jgi:hypothetical protein
MESIAALGVKRVDVLRNPSPGSPALGGSAFQGGTIYGTAIFSSAP